MNEIDEHWSAYYEKGLDFTPITSDIAQKIAAYLPTDLPKTFLDLGCGTGQYCREMQKLGFKTLGIDASGEAIDRTKTSDKTNEYKQVDIETDDIEGIFSLVACKYVFAFIKNRPEFLQKVYILLPANGIFALLTPSPEAQPAEKQGITVNFEQTLGLLTQFFEVDYFKDDHTTYFICKKV